MKIADLLFWNVDTQFDFVSPDGKLYVNDAENLKFKWKKLTVLAEQKSIRVVNTSDFHYSNSAELDSNPDFVNTFPPHCMAHTKGAAYIDETEPKSPIVFDWDKKYNSVSDLLSDEEHRNIVIRKDAFDVFKGNPFTESILNFLSPKIVVVYGVTTNVCVNDAVVGLASRVERVYVIEDAIKELPNIPLPFENWKKLAVELIQFNELEKLLK